VESPNRTLFRLADRRTNRRTLRSPAHAGERELSTPKAVIFDIGRVIVRVDPKRAFAPIAAALNDAAGPSIKSPSPENAWELIRADERWHDWQEGRMPPAEWHKHLMRRLKLSLGYDEFRDAWNRVLDPDLILSESLFAQLAAHCRLALLSNTDPIHAQCLEERFTFGRHFPVRIYSCNLGASKPSAAIYRKTLEALGVAAQEALYVDDIQEFVDAARKIGLDAIRFTTRDLLEGELQKRHLS
jgi:HAD superfamily hydrolase (TIGR01509 family)